MADLTDATGDTSWYNCAPEPELYGGRMSDNVCRVVAVATVKGGSGKTTIAMCLAAHWHEDGLKTAVIDTDPQRSARRWVFSGAELEMMRIDVCAADDGAGVGERIAQLAAAGFERIVIDTPGFRSPALFRALAHADLALVPVRPSPVDFEVAADTYDLLKDVVAERPADRPLRVRMVLSQAASRTVIARHMRAELLAAGYPLLTAELTHRVAYAEAPFSGSVPNLVEPWGAAAREVDALRAEVDAVLAEG